MIRTRFAPSPTGFLHIGGLRTALYSYLYAKQNNGTVILRIEDTDRTRFVEGAMESLIQSLNTVGLDYDEGPGKEGKFGPYMQSQRTDIYKKHAQILLDKGSAYHCFCTAERLTEMRTKQEALKLAPMYDRKCLNLSPEEIRLKIEAKTPYVIRLKIPRGETIEFNDIIKGNVKFESSTIDDQVLLKSDGYPTYHLAIIDDHLMEITHVIRGEDWLPSTPKHIIMYRAFGWEPPKFAHLPLILNKDKTKLSKRKNDVSVENYLKKGYSPEALINFIALQGWHPGEGTEEEMFSLQDLLTKFNLEKVHTAGAIFDPDKLDWFNFQWQKKHHCEKLNKIAAEIDPRFTASLNQKNETVYSFSSPENQNKFIKKRGELLFELCKTHLPAEYISDNAKLLKALVTVEEKILKKPSDTAQYIQFYFTPKDFPIELLLNAKMKVDQSTALAALEKSRELLAGHNDFDRIESIQPPLLDLIQKLGLKNGQVLWPIRVVLSGEEFSPGTFELIWVLGRDETISRIDNALTKLK